VGAEAADGRRRRAFKDLTEKSFELFSLMPRSASWTLARSPARKFEKNSIELCHLGFQFAHGDEADGCFVTAFFNSNRDCWTGPGGQESWTISQDTGPSVELTVNRPQASLVCNARNPRVRRTLMICHEVIVVSFLHLLVSDARGDSVMRTHGTHTNSHTRTRERTRTEMSFSFPRSMRGSLGDACMHACECEQLSNNLGNLREHVLDTGESSVAQQARPARPPRFPLLPRNRVGHLLQRDWHIPTGMSHRARAAKRGTKVCTPARTLSAHAPGLVTGHVITDHVSGWQRCVSPQAEV